jgi:hypothetical protein
MVVAIDFSSATLTPTVYPSVIDPAVDYDHPLFAKHTVGDLLNDLLTLVKGKKAFFPSTSIQATGTVRLTGAAGDNASNWELGFLQAQWIETNWGHYKANWRDGSAMKAGSVFLQRGKPPSRPKQGCRDSLHAASAIWYNRNLPTPQNMTGGPGAFPQTLTAQFFDQPGDSYPTLVVNSLTNQVNFLTAAQLEFHFCTALVVRDPAGVFHHLKHFIWNLHWQANFRPNDFKAPAGGWTVSKVAAGMTPPPPATGRPKNVSPVYTGTPTDVRFRDILTSTTETETCNQVFIKARDNVLTAPYTGRRESVDRDEYYDVRV